MITMEKRSHSSTEPPSERRKSDAPSFEWVRSAANIPDEAWSYSFSNQDTMLKSKAYHLGLEDAKKDEIDFYYLLIKNNDAKIIGIVACCVCYFALDTLTVKKTRAFFNFIKRTLRKKELMAKTFLVGPYTAACDHLFGLEHVFSQYEPEATQKIMQVIDKKSKELKCFMTIVKEIPQAECEVYERHLFNSAYLKAPSLPTTILKLQENIPYLTQVNRPKKQNINAMLRAFKKFELKWEEVNENTISPKDVAAIEALYLKVLNDAENHLDKMNAAYFINLLKLPDAKIHVCRNSSGEIIAFISTLSTKDKMFPLYLGYSDDYKDAKIYFNLLYKIILLAEEKNISLIEFGQTTYFVKVGFGGEMADLYLYSKINNPILNYLSRPFKNILYPKTEKIHRDVFKKQQ